MSFQTDKTVVMAVVVFQEHMGPICNNVKARGLNRNVTAFKLVRDPASLILNRMFVVFGAAVAVAQSPEPHDAPSSRACEL